MATIELSVRTRTDDTTDIGAIWKAAIVRYEEITQVKISSVAGANNVDEILEDIREKESLYKAKRHDGTKIDKFRSLISKALAPIETLSSIVAQVTLPFPPSIAIFTAVSLLIKAVNSVSSDYEKVAALFEDLCLYLSRLKILEDWVPPIAELKAALTEVLTSVLVLCAISTKYIKMKRIVKGFRNMISGEDDELSAAYTHFHKMVEQENGVVRNATLAAVGKLQMESTTIQGIIQENLIMTERTRLDVKTVEASTSYLQRLLESREAELQHADILARLSSLEFHDKQKDVFAIHHEGTGHWLLDTDLFRQWLKGDGPLILWCPGIPGAGKTVMTSIIVNHIQEIIRGTNAAITYIYCDYKNSKTWSELGLLSSIARRLTEQTKAIPPIVREFCDQNAEKRRNPTGNEWVSLINSLCLLFQTTYVFIDAIDECFEISRDKFLNLIGGLMPLVKVFITSRPHLDLKANFISLSRIDLFANASDIKTFLKHEIKISSRLSRLCARDVELEEDIIVNLTDKAAGMFLLAFLHIDHLRRQQSIKAVRKAMSVLPRGVVEFYDKAMGRIEMQQEEDTSLAKRALSYIFCAKRPLNINELLHLLDVEVEDVGLDETAIPETEILLIVSAEYLEGNPAKLLPDPEVKIARACLTYLSFDVFDRGPYNNSEQLRQCLEVYQLLDYASHHWGSHLSENQLHGDIVDLVFAFLKDKGKLSFFVQLLYITVSRTNDWHERFPKQFSPKHVAAYWGLDKIFLGLSEKGTEIDSQDSYGDTALQLAAKHGHKSMVQLLLDQGADANIKNRNSETALYWAAKNGHGTVVGLLLPSTTNILAKDNEGWTALDWAVVQGSNDVLEMLLQNGIDLDAESGGRNKALYLAAEEGHELTVQMLLERGADVNAQDSLGSTALDFAVTPGHEATAQLLLRYGADIKLRDTYQNTVLHWAVPFVALVQLLLNYGADVNAKNGDGQAALCWAAQDGPVEVVKLILDCKAKINAQDANGFSALHRATLRGREAVVGLLLDSGANPNAEDGDGWTPLHVAALKQHDELIKVLLERTKNGTAILDRVTSQVQRGQTRALLEEKAEQKAAASTAMTGLRETIQENQLGRSQALLDKGADVNGKDMGGWTALVIATGRGSEKAVRFLLDNGADVNIKGYDERSALHWAAEYGQEEIMRLLLEGGAEVNASAFGWTAMLI